MYSFYRYASPLSRCRTESVKESPKLNGLGLNSLGDVKRSKGI